MIKVYVININNVLLDEKHIPKYCQDMVNKYHLNSDRKKSLIGWLVLGKVLKEQYNIDIEKCPILKNKYGKPYIEKNIYFNISHCDDFVGVVVGDQKCGIDIEKVNSEKCSDSLVKKVLSEDEYNYYNSNKNFEFFFEKWVVKEAYYKREGTGINLKNISENILEIPYIEKFSYLNNKYVYAVFPEIKEKDRAFI